MVLNLTDHLHLNFLVAREHEINIKKVYLKVFNNKCLKKKFSPMYVIFFNIKNILFALKKYLLYLLCRYCYSLKQPFTEMLYPSRDLTLVFARKTNRYFTYK